MVTPGAGTGTEVRAGKRGLDWRHGLIGARKRALPEGDASACPVSAKPAVTYGGRKAFTAIHAFKGNA